MKLIYSLYASGKSVRAIADVLESKGVKSMRGKDEMSPKAILKILKNEIYKGDRCIQKNPHCNVLTHKPEKGTAYTSYYVEDDHEPIVSKELWDEVQAIFASPVDPRTYRNKNSHFLKGKIICGECGSEFVRITRKGANGSFKNWVCTDRRAGKNGNGCKCCILREDELLAQLETNQIEKIYVFGDGRIKVKAA